MFSACDIALPSFDDEAAAWGDADPATSVARIAALGVEEIVVKNGAGPALVFADGALARIPASAASDARDTTGAGDSFNAGYLASRLAGLVPAEACDLAHELAAEVIRHPGALAPASEIEPIRRALRARAGA
jgi:2-dehydro-3-deoxygluconokinase